MRTRSIRRIRQNARGKCRTLGESQRFWWAARQFYNSARGPPKRFQNTVINPVYDYYPGDVSI